jgi:hypothetical protein
MLAPLPVAVVAACERVCTRPESDDHGNSGDQLQHESSIGCVRMALYRLGV